MSEPGPEAWLGRLAVWLQPFLAALPRAEQRRWAPLYVRGLLLPGERKSVEPMAGRVCPGQVQGLHHFVSASPWPHGRLERVLAEQAGHLLGGPDAVLVVDDRALVKQGRHSVGVARQHCGRLGKRANCQALVSLTLARGEVSVPVALRPFLPDAWVKDADRRRAAGVPDDVKGRPKWQVAFDEISRLRGQGVRFGCVLGDAEYGKAALFRHALDEAGLLWALGILPNQKVFPPDVTTALPERKRHGRPPKHPVPSVPSAPVASLFADPPDAAFRTLSWRTGTKGPLRAASAARRVRIADGPEAAGAQHLPGGERWLVCEHPRPAGASSTSPATRRTPPLSSLPPPSRPAGPASRPISSSRKNRASTTTRDAPGAGCTTTPCCARSRTPCCNPCGTGGGRQDAPDQAGSPAPPGPPPRPTLPEARRHVVAALLDHLAHRPNCGHRTPWHMLA